MSIKLEKFTRAIEKRLDDMASQVRDPTAFLNRQVYSMYQKAQIARWDSENVTEGMRWEPLEKKYALRKLKKYSGYAYNGTHILVATGKLLKSVVGTDTEFHRKIATEKGLTVQTTLLYAPYVAEKRPFMKFSDSTLQTWKKAVTDYVMGRSVET